MRRPAQKTLSRVHFVAISAACLRRFATTLGQRLWRRPLDAARLDALVQALLESPAFIHRVEIG